MNRTIILSWLVAAVVFGAIQFVPVERTNPPVARDVPAPPEVKAVLRRACYDCHSNETHWPWYSRIAPISWMVARDVREGRAELNFSTWNLYSAKERVGKLHESWETVAEGEMPLRFYIAPHRRARLSAHDRALLQQWAADRSER
jgi:hypothetical protein